jgi:hypothetical protein
MFSRPSRENVPIWNLMFFVLLVAGLLFIWLAVEFQFFGLTASAIGELPVRMLVMILGVLILVWLWRRPKWH